MICKETTDTTQCLSLAVSTSIRIRAVWPKPTLVHTTLTRRASCSLSSLRLRPCSTHALKKKPSVKLSKSSHALRGSSKCANKRRLWASSLWAIMQLKSKLRPKSRPNSKDITNILKSRDRSSTWNSLRLRKWKGQVWPCARHKTLKKRALTLNWPKNKKRFKISKTLEAVDLQLLPKKNAFRMNKNT